MNHHAAEVYIRAERRRKRGEGRPSPEAPGRHSEARVVRPPTLMFDGLMTAGTPINATRERVRS